MAGEGCWAFGRIGDFRLYHGDMRDRRAVHDARGNASSGSSCCDCRGPRVRKNPDEARSINQEASLMLLEESKLLGVVRFVFASTCSNYGKMADSGKLLDEASELRPVSLYAETKMPWKKKYWIRRGQIRCARPALRFATVFGVSPRMRFDLTVNHFTMEMMVKQELLVYGEQFWRPYVGVRDVGRAVATVCWCAREGGQQSGFQRRPANKTTRSGNWWR